MPKVKTKKRSRKSLVNEADKAMSLYIRARDKYCVVCGSSQNLTNGHLFSRVAYSTRWSELNCACQCLSCNLSHEYDPYPFTTWFINKHGEEMWHDLHRRYKKVKKFYDKDLIEIAEEYSQKLQSLISES